MPDKYRYVSVCERKKPIQTNSKQAFMMHVISCPTCQEKLPASIIKQLEPKLSELKAKRIKSIQPLGKPTPSAQKIITKESQKGAKEGLIDEGEVKPLSPEEAAEIEQQAKRVQLDALIKDSPSFQGLEKSVEGAQGNIKKLSEQFDGFDKRISSEFASLGETLMAKITGQPPVVEKDAGETGKEPPAKPGLSDAGETPGKILSEDQERLHEGGEDLAGGAGGVGQRPSPFGSPDQIPAAMRPDYIPGQTPPKKTPSPETGASPQEMPKTEETPIVEKSKDVPDLTDPREIEAVEAWLADQKRKQGVGAEEKPKKKGGIPYIGDLKDVIREGKELIDAWRGKGEGEGPPLSGDISQAISFAKTMNEFSTSQLKNVFEMIRALREAEKLIYVPVSSGGARTSSSPETGPSELKHVS